MNQTNNKPYSVAIACVMGVAFLTFLSPDTVHLQASTTNPTPGSASACFPAPLMTLIERWEGSSLVIRANVTESVERENRFHSTLQVRTTLKGRLPDGPNEIVIQSLRGGCPFPYQFKVGTDVIVFLRYDMDIRAWVPTGHVEGAIEVDDRSFAVFAKMFERLPAIVELESDSDERLAAMMDWYVDCMLSPLTDHGSTSELRREGWRGIHRVRWLHKRQKHVSKLDDPLSKKHREKILAVLLTEVPPKPGAAGMLDYVADMESRQLDLPP